MSQYKELADRLESLKYKACDEAAAILRSLDAQEPTAFLHDDGYWSENKTEQGRRIAAKLSFAGADKIAVYAAPVAAKPRELTQDESAVLRGAIFDSCEVVAAQPHQAKPEPLSDAEIMAIIEQADGTELSDIECARAVIAAFCRKNGIKEQL